MNKYTRNAEFHDRQPKNERKKTENGNPKHNMDTIVVAHLAITTLRFCDMTPIDLVID